MSALKSKSTASPHFDISTVLRPSERLSISIPCRVRTDGLEFHRAEAGVVYHQNGTVDEAALFVAVPSETTSDLRLTHVVPVTKDFKHSLNQTPPSPSTSFFHQSSRPHITLSLWTATAKVELRISSALIAQVQAFVAEIKRWTDAEETAHPSMTAHSWTQFYPARPPDISIEDEEDLVTSSSVTSTSALSPSLSSASGQTLQSPLTSLTIGSSDAVEDDEFPNPFLPGFSRTATLRKRLFARQVQWSERRKIKIRLATYNVNDKLPPPGTTELTPMVGNGEEDILVFGFQEVDLRSQALLMSQGNVRADEWEAAICRGLKEKGGEYVKVAMTQYVGVVTIVLAKHSIREAITSVETSERGIGLLGFGGNKAGVCVRMKVHDSTFCFVNSHLAAFATALDRRRADYHVLLKTLSFPRPSGDIPPAFDEFGNETRDKLVSIEDSHLMFWVGDLNYRIDMEDDILRAWVNEQRWKAVLEKDQLISDIASGQSFAGFQEHPIDFPPSFKYVHGSSTLDTRRAPAYTDRILYRLPQTSSIHSPPTAITGLSYTSHEIFWSDHRPVSGSYEVDVRVADEEKRRSSYIEVERELDLLEELYRPNLDVEGTNLEFGEVSLRRSSVQTVTLRNKGRVPASFKFKAPSQGKPICKATVWPFPSNGTIDPGSESTLQVTVHVEEPLAKSLTLGQAELNDVLVLQVNEGKETFITVQATFKPTILALPLPVLSILPGPITTLPLSARKELGARDDAHESKGSKPVKEVWTLLEYLMAAAPCPNVWAEEAEQAAVLTVLDAVDSGAALPVDTTPAAVANCLAFVLGWVPGGLLGEQRARCEMAKDRDDAFAAIEGLSQVQTNILIGLMSVVRLCAGVEGTLASARATPISEQPPALAHSSESDGDAGAKTGEDAVDELGGENDDSAKAIPTKPTVPALTTPLAVATAPPSNVDEQTVEALVPCVFGVEGGINEARRQFVRCMLEG